MTSESQRTKVKVEPPKNEEHFDSSLQLIYTFKTHTKTVGGPLLAALAASLCGFIVGLLNNLFYSDFFTRSIQLITGFS